MTRGYIAHNQEIILYSSMCYGGLEARGRYAGRTVVRSGTRFEIDARWTLASALGLSRLSTLRSSSMHSTSPFSICNERIFFLFLYSLSLLAFADRHLDCWESSLLAIPAAALLCVVSFYATEPASSRSRLF
jgi:hypothetical protein